MRHRVGGKAYTQSGAGGNYSRTITLHRGRVGEAVRADCSWKHNHHHGSVLAASVMYDVVLYNKFG